MSYALRSSGGKVTCEVCGGQNFEKHAGFMYCATCQTQSQDYHEQEYEFHESTVIRSVSSQRTQKTKQKKQKEYDDGVWTSWEAFNYILHGMTQELKKLDVPSDFENLVLKLWACYLKECNVAFTSKSKEGLPKLRLNFKLRDARVLYNVDVTSNSLRNKRSRSTSVSSKLSNTSMSSASSISKRSLSLKKSKIIASDYQEHLSASMLSGSSLANETLESLGRSSETELTGESSEEKEGSVKHFKEMMTKKDYILYKNCRYSSKSMESAKDWAKRNVRCMAKNKLLSILHLALLMTGCSIQLSDLLRFIREGHLSYAKVTHFLPWDVKFCKNDFSYIDVIADGLMPTHLRQRKISSQLAHLLKIRSVPTPNMNALVDRYCNDLNLPDGVKKYSKKILQGYAPEGTLPKAKSSLPSYEAWAMASILFVMKLLFGLNDKTERFLSCLARQVNSVKKGSSKSKLFAFEDWQKFIECRKAILIEFHYPTQEQLDGNGIRSSKQFLDMLMKETKDEHRKERFIPYPKYYIDEKLMDSVKQMLSVLTKPQEVEAIDFEPSLTPQTSHLKTILEELSGRRSGTDEWDLHERFNHPESILSQKFGNCDVNFAFDPKTCLKSLGEDASEFLKKFDVTLESLSEENESDQDKSTNLELLFNCSSNYWVRHFPNKKSAQLSNFKEEVLEKTPQNFQWLVTECSRMIEMNVRDVYEELLRLEDKFRVDE